MPDSATIQKSVFEPIVSVAEDAVMEVIEDTPLIGSGSLLDSMKLVELCLLLEDLAGDLDFEFDWTSEVMLSKSKSMFRSAGALAAEFISQKEAGA